MHQLDSIDALEAQATEVAATLRLLANEKRLIILCRLAIAGEMSVTALGAAVRLSQSALSQHLAKLRADGLVATRRDAQMLFYRVEDARIRQLLTALKDIYCPDLC